MRCRPAGPVRGAESWACLPGADEQQGGCVCAGRGSGSEDRAGRPEQWSRPGDTGAAASKDDAHTDEKANGTAVRSRARAKTARGADGRGRSAKCRRDGRDGRATHDVAAQEDEARASKGRERRGRAGGWKRFSAAGGGRGAGGREGRGERRRGLPVGSLADRICTKRRRMAGPAEERMRSLASRRQTTGSKGEGKRRERKESSGTRGLGTRPQKDKEC